MTLLAEDLLLLVLDDRTGKVVSSNLDTALGGAVLIELALADTIEVSKGEGLWARSKVRPIASSPRPSDPVLGNGLDLVAAKERSAQDLVVRLGKGVRRTLLERLQTRGVLRLEEDKVLGLFPRKRWPTVDSSHEDAVRRQISAALLEGATPDDRTAALIALLLAIDRAHRTVDLDGVSARTVKKRAKEIAEGDWAAKAVRDAVAAAQAAMMAAVMASTTAATTSSG